MKRNLNLFLNDILESIIKIDSYTKGVLKSKFLKDDKLQDAVIRRLEIIGEATKNIPPSFRKKYPSIEWQKIAGLRDVLIHAYFGIDPSRVWKVAKKDLGELKKNIKEILKKEVIKHGK